MTTVKHPFRYHLIQVINTSILAHLSEKPESWGVGVGVHVMDALEVTGVFDECKKEGVMEERARAKAIVERLIPCRNPDGTYPCDHCNLLIHLEEETLLQSDDSVDGMPTKFVK